eukprot:4546302-Alexandrium_andersonii.AAC.1
MPIRCCGGPGRESSFGRQAPGCHHWCGARGRTECTIAELCRLGGPSENSSGSLVRTSTVSR